MLYPRNLKDVVLDAANHSRVILVNGARQTGKSTLVLGLFSARERPPYVTMDDLTILSAAGNSPKSFIQRYKDRVVIDEIQRVPDLLLAIKENVDRDKRPGRFFLTGSANVLMLPAVSDSLAGRMQIHTLWPLSQGEIKKVKEDFIDTIFGGDPLPTVRAIDEESLLNLLVAGGYPDAFQAKDELKRTLWFESYVKTIMERDIRDLSNIEGLASLPNLLALLASRSGGLLNIADLSRSLELPQTTLKRYMTLLEQVFFIVRVASWSSNLGKRLVKAPKIFLNDSGLLCYLSGVNLAGLNANRPLLGAVFENFVVLELLKQISWSIIRPKLLHFHTNTGREVDIVLEGRDGKVVGIECKMSSTVKSEHFKGLRVLKETCGKRFHRGIVLYTGSETVSFDDDLEAAPVSALWQITSGAATKLTEAKL
jgi:predicted AAA+ superfamily ATPase